MARLLIHVEGETEETFVKEVLTGHLRGHGFSSVGARLLGNARQRSRRGGIRSWPSVRGDIVRHLREDGRCLVTTMVDYYALPQTGERAWPGRADAGLRPFEDKASTVESAMAAEVYEEMGAGFERARFLPFVVIHEFEGLLFSDCARFANGVGRPDLFPRLQEIRDTFDTPEQINDSPTTAPSKRVEVLIPGYQKPLQGNLAALEVGLDAIRAECPHFRSWLEALERLPKRGER